MKCLNLENQTTVTEFLLMGIPDYQHHQLAFILLLILYVLALAGNIFIITVVNLDPQLHTPMYFFLSNLSFVDLCIPSISIPNFIDSLLSMTRSISLLGCIMQMYMFLWLVCVENFLLAVMAFDRYEAICNPLHYTTVMSKKLCVQLVVASWILSCPHASFYVIKTFSLCFCGPNTIHSFFCDQPPVMELSCTDTFITHLELLAEATSLAIVVSFIILGSYAWIITAILKLHSAESRKKAFMTCSSHLTVITLFYGSVVAVYYLPSSASSNENSIMASLIYALVTPMLNPYIYSLRNKEIKVALIKGLRRKICH